MPERDWWARTQHPAGVSGTWRDYLKPGSYSAHVDPEGTGKSGPLVSVDFHTTVATTDFGRRVIEHTFPFKELPFIQDMGKLPRRFTLDIFLLGHDYLVQLAKTMQIWETPGPHTLHHPIFGKQLVQLVSPVSAPVVMREQKIVRFTLDLVRVKKDFSTIKVRVAPTAVTDWATTSLDDWYARALSKLDTNGTLSIVDRLKKDIKKFNSAVRQMTKLIPMQDALALTDLMRTLQAADVELAGSITQPRLFLDLIQSAVAPISGLITGERVPASVQALAFLMNFGADSNAPALPGFEKSNTLEPIIGFGSSRVTMETNRKAIVSAIREAVAVQAALGAVAYEYESYDDAVKVADIMAEALDSIKYTSSDAQDNGTADALSTLKSLVVDVLEQKGADLASISYVTVPHGSMSAAQLAYALYGDIGREAEIIARNRKVMPNPCFVPPGVELEVLSE